MFAHFLPECLRPLIDQCDVHAGGILIMVFFHLLCPKGGIGIRNSYVIDRYLKTKLLQYYEKDIYYPSAVIVAG